MHFRIPAAALSLLALAACGGSEPQPPQAQEEAAPSPSETITEAPMPFQLTSEQAEGKVVYRITSYNVCYTKLLRPKSPKYLGRV